MTKKADLFTDEFLKAERGNRPADGTPPSRTRHTDEYSKESKNLYIHHRLRMIAKSERFIAGPIPLSWVHKAFWLKGISLGVYLLVIHRVGLTGSYKIQLPGKLREEFGIGRSSMARALRKLEVANLIAMDRTLGCSPWITLLIPDDSESDAGSSSYPRSTDR